MRAKREEIIQAKLKLKMERRGLIEEWFKVQVFCVRKNIFVVFHLCYHIGYNPFPIISVSNKFRFP